MFIAFEKYAMSAKDFSKESGLPVASTEVGRQNMTFPVRTSSG